jgi:predicted nuclease of predicted toxin-antitoxin system
MSPGLATWLTRQGHDAVHAAALGLDRANDEAIIARARAEGRTVVTADLDYPRLLAMEQAIAPALILFRGGQFSEAESVSLSAAALAALSEQELSGSLLVIERHRLRRRQLPIVGGG